MALSKIERSLLNVWIKKFAKWMVEKKDGTLYISPTEINDWLKENGFEFSLEIRGLGTTLEIKYHGKREEDKESTTQN